MVQELETGEEEETAMAPPTMTPTEAIRPVMNPNHPLPKRRTIKRVSTKMPKRKTITQMSTKLWTLETAKTVVLNAPSRRKYYNSFSPSISSGHGCPKGKKGKKRRRKPRKKRRAAATSGNGGGNGGDDNASSESDASEGSSVSSSSHEQKISPDQGDLNSIGKQIAKGLQPLTSALVAQIEAQSKHMETQVDMQKSEVAKKDRKSSATNALTDLALNGIKVLLNPDEESGDYAMDPEDLPLSKTMTQICSKGNSSTIMQKFQEQTSTVNCHCKPKLFLDFIKKTGFFLPDGSAIGGFTIFMIGTSYANLSLEYRAELKLLRDLSDDDHLDTVLPTTTYQIPKDSSDVMRMLAGYCNILQVLADGTATALARGAELMLDLVKQDGQLLESSALVRTEFYTQVLYSFDLTQNIFIKNVRKLVISGETEIPSNLIFERNRRLKLIFEDISYGKFNPDLPAELTSSRQQARLPSSSTGGNLGGNNTQQLGQTPPGPPGKKNRNYRLWFSVKPEDDNSSNWHCTPAVFQTKFGNHARGKENNATFAKIRVGHHRAKQPNDKTKRLQTSPCPKYVCTGACSSTQCKLSHFAKSKASTLMNGDAKGKAAIEKINAACTAIFS